MQFLRLPCAECQRHLAVLAINVMLYVTPENCGYVEYVCAYCDERNSLPVGPGQVRRLRTLHVPEPGFEARVSQDLSDEKLAATLVRWDRDI